MVSTMLNSDLLCVVTFPWQWVQSSAWPDPNAVLTQKQSLRLLHSITLHLDEVQKHAKLKTKTMEKSILFSLGQWLASPLSVRSKGMESTSLGP